MLGQSAASKNGITRRRALALGGVAAASCFVLGGCSGAQDQAADKPAASTGEPELSDTLRMALAVDLDGLDPQRTAAAATFEITNNIYDPLIKVTAQNELVSGLAQSWEVAPDGMSVTFTLRAGVEFSNGKPCDAAAVVASFERLQDAESPRVTEYAGYTFEALDDVTVVVTSAELNVAMLTDFAYAWAAVVDASSADTLASKPVGTGPYTLQNWTPQQSITLAANPSYWGEAPGTKNVVLTILPDSTSQASSLRAGDIDLMQVQVNSQAEAFDGDDAFQIMTFTMNGVQLMAMNCSNEFLSDERVRQAINMAVDKDALIDAVWSGYGEKIGSHFPPVLEGYVDCTGTYAYDPEAARALLKEAGHESDVTLRMRLPKSYQVYVDAGQVIADNLKQVGITCDVEIIEWSAWLSEVYTGHDYDLTVVGHTGRLDPITLLARYDSASSENYFNYANAQVDDDIASYRTELDATKRQAYVEDIQKTLATEVPALYIQTPVMIYLASGKVHDFVLYPVDVYEFKDVWVEA